MSKKVLVLPSSPRGDGNSDLLCNEFIFGAKESGNQVKRISLRNKEINYCLAYDACQRKESQLKVSHFPKRYCNSFKRWLRDVNSERLELCAQ